MLNRLCFLLICLFWITMNVLLWRSEFGGKREHSSAVPVGMVWNKILTAPDDSALEISHQGKRMGFCRWAVNLGEELATGKVSSEEYLPEGRVKELTSYSLDLEGNVALKEMQTRLRFQLGIRFATNQVWEEFTVRLAVRPGAWEIHARAAEQTLRLKYEEPSSKWEQAFTFAELRDPQGLLERMGGGWALELLGQSGILSKPESLELGLDWQARHDWLKIGHSQVRVYRLEARLLERYQAVVIVSRVGEILRVELPNNMVLVNDALIKF